VSFDNVTDTGELIDRKFGHGKSIFERVFDEFSETDIINVINTTSVKFHNVVGEFRVHLYINMFHISIMFPFFLLFGLGLLLLKTFRQKYLKMRWDFGLINFLPLIILQIPIQLWWNTAVYWY